MNAASYTKCPAELMRRNLIVAMILALQGICVARADSNMDTRTVHGLYRACTSASTAFASYCAGFIAGVGQMMHVSTAILQKREVRLNSDWCAPAGTTPEQAIQAFKNWHDKHPEHWEGAAVLGVVTTLQATWPCAAPSDNTNKGTSP